ncbi:hypothetical protein F4861DRAFT_189252 [Xylaria intraflava]|nr:hypothetical protein F4861DRAFT_189252 [Xylaria intraflava]
MGFFDSWDGASVISRKSHKSHKHHKRSRSPSRSRSRERHSTRRHSASGLDALLGDDGHYSKHNASRGSLFNLGNNSTRSFFSTGRSSSYYKRSPRANFMTRAYKKLKRMLRDLLYWAKRHPMKVFMFIIVPLITGGALTALLARFGLRLPARLERMLGIAAKTAGGSGGIGLMGEAVRMATTGRGAGASADRGYDSDLIYEKRRTDYADYSGGSSRGGKGFFGKIGEFFS